MKRLTVIVTCVALVLGLTAAPAGAIDCPSWLPAHVLAACQAVNPTDGSTPPPWQAPNGTYEEMLQGLSLDYHWNFDTGVTSYPTTLYGNQSHPTLYLENWGNPPPALVSPPIAGRVTADAENPQSFPAGRSLELVPSAYVVRSTVSNGLDYGQESFAISMAVKLYALPTGSGTQAQGILFHRLVTIAGGTDNSGYYVAVNPDGSLLMYTKAQGSSAATSATSAAGVMQAGTTKRVTFVFSVASGETTGTGKLYVDGTQVLTSGPMQRPTEGRSRRFVLGGAANGSEILSSLTLRLNGVVDELVTWHQIAVSGQMLDTLVQGSVPGTYAPDSLVDDPTTTPTTLPNPGGVTDSTTTDRTLADRILGGLSWLGGTIVAPLRGIYTVLQDGLGWIGGLLTQLKDWLAVGFSSVVNAIGDIAGWLADGFASVVNAVQVVVDKLTDLPAAIWNAAQAFFVPESLNVPVVDEFAGKFPVSWIAAGVDGAEALIAGVNGGMAASCGPEIGAPPPVDIHFSLNPAGSGCEGTGPGGARTAEDDAAGELWGYREPIRAVMAAALYLAVVWWGVSMLPWLRARDLPLAPGTE